MYVCMYIYIYTIQIYIHIYIYIYIYRHIIYIYIYISYGEYPITMVICGYSGESSPLYGENGDVSWQYNGDSMGIWGIIMDLPSGKHTKNYRKSPFRIGKSTN